MIDSGNRVNLVRIGMTAIVGMAAMLGGCAGKPPTFKVVDVAITEESPEASVVTFMLEGENAGKEPLPLREINYSLTLDGQHVFNGYRRAEVTLPAGGPPQRIALPVVVKTADTGGQPLGQREYRFSGSVEYIVPGALAEYFFDSGVRRPSTGFGEGGKLDFTSAEAPVPANDTATK